MILINEPRPFPWEAVVVFLNNEPSRVIVRPRAWGAQAVADCGVVSDESWGNAVLMAAAPKMAEVLQWWLAQMQDDACDDMGKLLDEMTRRVEGALPEVPLKAAAS